VQRFGADNSISRVDSATISAIAAYGDLAHRDITPVLADVFPHSEEVM